MLAGQPIGEPFEASVRVSVRVAVKYQACTDEVCYPPKTKEVTLTARVN